MRTTAAVLDTCSGYNIIRRSELSVYWQLHAIPPYKISAVGDANDNLLQILMAVILRMRFEDTVHRTIVLATHHISAEVLTGNQFMNCFVNSICCIDQQVQFTKSKILL